MVAEGDEVAVQRALGEVVVAFNQNGVVAFSNEGVVPDGAHGGFFVCGCVAIVNTKIAIHMPSCQKK